jgi:hypothetical protein
LKGVVIVRPLAFKLLTLALILILLLSLSLSAFALPMRYWLATRDVDEQPYPAASGNVTYFVVLKTTYGIVLIPIFVKSSKVSNAVTTEKSTSSSGKNEILD